MRNNQNVIWVKFSTLGCFVDSCHNLEPKFVSNHLLIEIANKFVRTATF
jgi:hypothetical protein